jgi:TM2 domain
MKSLRQFFFTGLAIALFLSSCTMEKRVYMSGYHIEWNKSKHNSDKQELSSNDNGKQNQASVGEHSVNETGTPDNSFEPMAADNNITASTDHNTIVVPAHETVAFDRKINAFPVKISLDSKTKSIIADKVSKVKKKTEKRNSGGGGKSQLIALLLCIFVGGIGIHRFYLGYIGIGIAQVLTLGGCGIWALIDLIRIITGDLKPKDGDYGTKL